MIEQWDTFFTRTDRFVCRCNGGSLITDCGSWEGKPIASVRPSFRLFVSTVIFQTNGDL